MKIGKKRKKPRPQGQQPEELEKNQDPSKENKETEEDTEETEEDSPTESLPPAAPEGTAPEAEKEVTKGNKELFRVMHNYPDWPKTWLLIKNPQLLSNIYKTW